ncbi:MAG TPA: oxygenase MpaB family protein [Acidimicrobiales bacterium]|nr:oxygenase MpaB family protein [Acidimicrobiales bacterium]
MDLRQKIRDEIEAVGGRHDEPAVYDGPAGDPGLAGGPGSISWEINGDLASISLAGSAAVIMEVLHPSVMAGVSQQSTFRTQPLLRARNTLGYVLRTTFGSTEAATGVIEKVKRIHGRITGTRPDGVPYAALDPELIAWVHTCIPWAVMTAFDRYRRPLTPEEKDRYLAEQAVIGRMGGADEVPETVADLEAYVEAMRPRLSVNAQTREFIDFLAGDSDGEFRAGPLGQLRNRLGLSASMLLVPTWARHLTATYQPAVVQRAYLVPNAHLEARLVRWAYPELPCHRMAVARATGQAAATPSTAVA